MRDVETPAARRGEDGDVIAEWFDRHARALAGYASRRLGPDVARDIVADTFRIALQQHADYDPRRGNERAWLFGIASNLIRRHWRTEQRRLRRQARFLSADIAPADPLLRADERLDASARYLAVVDAVETLAPQDRDLLVLIAWEQFSSSEAAAVLGVPAGTVRSRLSRIRAQLARSVVQGETDG